MDKALLRDKGVSEPNLRPAFVSGFQLHIGYRATLAPASDRRVFGVVGSLSHTELEKLYSEPSVQAYKPEAVIAELLHGESLPVLCFNLAEQPNDDEHNPEYVAKLRSLATQLQFPEDYISSIQ